MGQSVLGDALPALIFVEPIVRMADWKLEPCKELFHGRKSQHMEGVPLVCNDVAREAVSLDSADCFNGPYPELH